VKYQLEREALLHDNGDANSPLRQLATQYGQANGNATPGYPTYVLIDPNGVIRDYILGADLNAVQASLANKTGKTLNQDWTDESLIPSYNPLTDLSVGSVSFKLWDGTAISLSGGGHLEDSHCIYDTSGGAILLDLWTKLGDPVTAGPVRDHSKLIDLHSPIAMKFKATVDPAPGTYRSIEVDDFKFFEVAPSYYPEGDAFKGSANPAATYNPDGSILVNFTPADFFVSQHWVGATDDDRASNYVAGGYNVSDPILPYQSTLALSSGVNNDPSLSSTTKATVTSLLQGGLAKLGSRDYAGSAQQFGKAASNLQGSAYAASAMTIQAHVAWLGTHY
jgi:hypothetical protein